MNDKRQNFLTHLLFESEAYRNIEDIEKLVEVSSDLSAIPVQPLYLSLRSTSKEHMASLLPRLSPKQRKALIDIDVWNRDNLDIKSFALWPSVYSRCKDLSVVKEFSKSDEFLLYLKSCFNIYTFNLEFPQYPDHDNFFLSDDDQFLFEYDKDFDQAREVQFLVKTLYSELGVEGAAFELMKIVNEPFTSFQEELYERKVSRQRDYGFVDYFDSLHFRASFTSEKQIESFIKKKDKTTGEIDGHGRNQTLHSSTLISFKNGIDSIHEELVKIVDSKRSDYLQFNFVRLVNGSIILDDALKSGSLAMTRTGQKTKQKLLLGLSYVQRIWGTKNHIFDVFDFADLYKIGHSLIHIQKNKLKKKLEASSFNSDDSDFFLGSFWSQFLNYTFDEVVKTFNKTDNKYIELTHISEYEVWKKNIHLLCSLFPFIEKFYESLTVLIKEGKINDEFYLNYTTDNIDFEAIIMSSFANFALGNFEKENVNKMGLSVQELKKFIKENFDLVDEKYYLKKITDEKMAKSIKDFNQQFGLATVDDFDSYLHLTIEESLNGYNFDELETEDFKHVGGPILLYGLH